MCQNQELFIQTASFTNDDTLAAISGSELVLNGPVLNKGIILVSGPGSVVDIFNFGEVSGPGIFKIETGGSLHVVGSASGLFLGSSARTRRSCWEQGASCRARSTAWKRAMRLT